MSESQIFSHLALLLSPHIQQNQHLVFGDSFLKNSLASRFYLIGDLQIMHVCERICRIVHSTDILPKKLNNSQYAIKPLDPTNKLVASPQV